MVCRVNGGLSSPLSFQNAAVALVFDGELHSCIVSSGLRVPGKEEVGGKGKGR